MKLIVGGEADHKHIRRNRSVKCYAEDSSRKDCRLGALRREVPISWDLIDKKEPAGKDSRPESKGLEAGRSARSREKTGGAAVWSLVREACRGKAVKWYGLGFRWLPQESQAAVEVGDLPSGNWKDWEGWWRGRDRFRIRLEIRIQQNLLRSWIVSHYGRVNH